MNNNRESLSAIIISYIEEAYEVGKKHTLASHEFTILFNKLTTDVNTILSLNAEYIERLEQQNKELRNLIERTLR